MNNIPTSPGRGRQRGAVAVETAIVLPLLVILLTVPTILLTLFFRQYSAAEKAAHDAALYLSTAPMVEMTTAGPDGSPAALTVAKKIVAKELVGLVPDDGSLLWDIVCEYRVGGTPLNRSCALLYLRDPSYTLVRVDVSISFDYIDPMTGMNTGVLISPYVPVRYVGS